MVWCKMAGSAFVLGSAFMFLFSVNHGLDNRLKQLRMLYSLLLQLKSEIQYMANPLPEAFFHLSNMTREPFSSWLINLSTRLEERCNDNFVEVWKQGLDSLLKQSDLIREDLAPLVELGDKLGEIDCSTTLKTVDYVLLQLDQNRKQLDQEIKQKKKIVATLSMFAGFMTLILLL